jgi:hypothetical protein
LNDQAAIAFVNVNGKFGLYHLTFKTTKRLAPPADLPSGQLEPGGWVLIKGGEDYAALLRVGSIPANDGLLLNLKAGKIEVLTGQVYNVGRGWPKFSKDGRYLRYLSRVGDEGDETVWTLWQRKLDSGEERSLATVTGLLPSLSSDSFGDSWLLIQSGRNQPMITTLVNAAGQRRVIAEESGAERQWRLLQQNDIFAYQPDCQADCILRAMPIPDGPARAFPLPNDETGKPVLVNYLTGVADNRLLLFTSGAGVWLAGVDSSPKRVGYWSPQKLTLPIDQLVSPDGRWVLILDDEKTNWQVWDNMRQKYVAQGDPNRQYAIVGIQYYNQGFVVNENLQRFWLYRYADGATVTLPGERRIYFDVLPDAHVLYAEYDSNAERGIYRYDPTADKAARLVPDSRPIVLGN